MHEIARPVLKFCRVRKRLPDGTIALAGVDLSVASGEFVGIVGPSGCGKSTLLRIASGLTAASDGDVQVDTDKIGYVFQDPTLPAVAHRPSQCRAARRAGRSPQAGRRRRADEAIRLVGLSEFARHHAAPGDQHLGRGPLLHPVLLRPRPRRSGRGHPDRAARGGAAQVRADHLAGAPAGAVRREPAYLDEELVDTDKRR
jgi:hypothetical protein